MKNGRPTLEEIDALEVGDTIIYGRSRSARKIIKVIRADTGKIKRCFASPARPYERPTSMQRTRLHADVHKILKAT